MSSLDIVTRRATPVPKVLDWFRGNTTIVFLLFLTFVTRFVVSSSSYQYDELLSVMIYGTDRSSAWDVVTTLGERSIHPPLYQFILFCWMSIFGDSEVATRSLSNLYVTGAALCVYLLVFRYLGQRRALASVLILSFLAVPVYYALESRSYAQTLFLASLSSLLLFSFLDKYKAGIGWKAMLLNRRFIGLVVTNLALISTHYFNVLFLAAQASFVLLFLCWRDASRPLLGNVVRAAVVSATPILLLLIFWGPVMVRSYERRTGRFLTEGSVRDIGSVFYEFIASANILQSRNVLAVIGLLTLVFLGQAVWRFVRARRRAPTPREWFYVYLLASLFLPLVFGFVLFYLSGHERYAIRYFIFSAIPVCVLLTLAVEEPFRLVALAIPRLRRFYIQTAAVWFIAVVAGLLLQNTFRLANHTEDDYRGVANMVLDFARSDGVDDITVYEVSHRPTLNFYFGKLDREIKVSDVVRRKDEERDTFRFEKDAEDIAKGDFFVLAFAHFRAHNFPKAQAKLSRLYQEQFRMLNEDGHGIIVYKVAQPSTEGQVSSNR